jgi:hypothetical protein
MGATEERPERFLVTDGSVSNFPSQKLLKAGSGGLFDLHYAKQATTISFFHSPWPLVGLPAFGQS